MRELATKISVERLPRNRNFHVHKDNLELGILTYINADDKNVEHRYETSAATVCFVRGTGKIAINGALVEYGGKWFEIPRMVEYQILPETDTVMLTIQKSPIAADDRKEDPLFARAVLHSA